MKGVSDLQIGFTAKSSFRAFCLNWHELNHLLLNINGKSSESPIFQNLDLNLKLFRRSNPVGMKPDKMLTLLSEIILPKQIHEHHFEGRFS
jgi:hypothetical protein